MKNLNAYRFGWAGLTLLLAAVTSHAARSPQDAGPSSPHALDARQISESISKYEALSREQPDSAEVWSNLGAVRAMAGDCRQALPALERAESLNARLFNPWFFSGYCYSVLHENRRAMEKLGNALRLNSRDANAWMLKAQVDRDLGDLVDSLDAVLHAHAAMPSNPEAYYFAGKDALELTAQSYDRVASKGPQSEFYSLFLDGQRNAAQGVWDLALDQYQRALKIMPERSDLHFAMGTANLEYGRFADAESSFRRCLQLSDSSWARLRLVMALGKESKEAEAREVFRSISLNELRFPAEYNDYVSCAVLLNSPKLAQLAFSQAQTKFPNQGEWKEWSKRLKSLSAQTPEDARDSAELEGLSGVGLSLRFCLSAKQAKGDEFKSLFASPATYQSFRSDFLAGKWMQAAEKVVPILRTERQAISPASAFALGEILQSLSYGFYAQLGADYPDSTPAMKLAAENLSTMGEQQKALEIYQGIVQRDGPSPPVMREMARIYWADHKWDQALDILQPLSQMDPNDATIFVNMGRIYAFEQKADNAAQAFEQAIRVDARMSEAHLGLGQVFRKQGDLQRALEESKIASQLDPKNPKPHYELSQIYGKLGDKELAAQEMASFQHLQTSASAEARQSDKMLVPLD
jgi:tetratricopeptide (TPR) repeat protein